MKSLVILIGAVLASVLLYLLTYSVVKRPLTLGDLTQQLDFKLDYSSALPSPKIVILAGSNGRYSHRCREFSEVLTLPCVNASIASGIGIDFLLDQFGATLRRGDIVYMPLEYGQYAVTEGEAHSGTQNAVLLLHRREYLWSLPALRIVQTYGAFDLPFLVRGLAEMALARTNFRRRTGIETLTRQGDEHGHTTELAQAFRTYVATAPAPDSRVPEDSFARGVLSRFLVDAKRNGVVVVGGLPTVPDDTVIAATDLTRIRSLFEGNGQRFVQTPNRSRFPRTCFFDTTYHLTESCQARHSFEAANALRSAVPEQHK